MSWSLCLNTVLEFTGINFSSTVIRRACVNGATKSGSVKNQHLDKALTVTKMNVSKILHHLIKSLFSK